jgi:hypothetical protein
MLLDLQVNTWPIWLLPISTTRKGLKSFESMGLSPAVNVAVGSGHLIVLHYLQVVLLVERCAEDLNGFWIDKVVHATTNLVSFQV